MYSQKKFKMLINYGISKSILFKKDNSRIQLMLFIILCKNFLDTIKAQIKHFSSKKKNAYDKIAHLLLFLKSEFIPNDFLGS